MQTYSALATDLVESDIRSILARNTVGRLAFVRGDQIDILPIQYVYHAQALYGRTSPGGKLAAVDPLGATVAFEVDEIGSVHHWRSVLVHGTFRVIDREAEHDDWLASLKIVRKLHKDALNQEDRRPDRTEIFRITIWNATGRALG